MRTWVAIALTCVAACGSSGATGDDAPVDANNGSGSDGAADGSGASTKFSFFVTSLKGLQELSGNTLGFGGDLRFGEVGDENSGAGLRGADKICAALAEKSLPGAGSKTWHAFLSATNDGTGHVVNAIDRIGTGPWYDRLDRVLSDSLTNIKATRPGGGDATIKNNFPNEYGVGNHNPDGTGEVDNHDMLTGSTTTGTLYQGKSTCLNWTGGTGNKTTEGLPRVGHSWPRGMGGMGGMSSMDAWMSSLTESGCAPGVNLVEMGGPQQNSNTVGSGGGYGGFYCFALN